MHLVFRVSPQDVPVFWEDSRKFIARCDNFKTKANDLLPLLEQDLRQLWIGLDQETGKLFGACITSIENYPQSRSLVITSIGGDGGDWSRLMKPIEQFALDEQCERIEIIGRLGWLRALDGYEVVSTTIAKTLEPQ